MNFLFKNQKLHFGHSLRTSGPVHSKYNHNHTSLVFRLCFLYQNSLHDMQFLQLFDSFVKIYPGAAHGWTTKYNSEDELAVKRAEEAHLDMLNWLTKYVK